MMFLTFLLLCFIDEDTVEWMRSLFSTFLLLLGALVIFVFTMNVLVKWVKDYKQSPSVNPFVLTQPYKGESNVNDQR
jgi:hypothetical protein